MVDGHELGGFDRADVGERHASKHLVVNDWISLHERYAHVER
jgi:hypothetical protein